MKRLYLFVVLMAGFFCGVDVPDIWAQAPPEPVSELEETFSGQALDEKAWVVIRLNDFQESTIDLVGGRLRLRAATINTADDTVKYHGVRSVSPVSLEAPLEISFELDWNNQANGCYLTAGMVLCPTATEANPNDEDAWFKMEYVGVPPGKNARASVSVRAKGRERVVYDEGWPREQRTGRKIGRQRVRIQWQGQTLTLVENDRILWKAKWPGFGFPAAYLYLQMSSHSNYRARQVFFDNVRKTRMEKQP